MHNPHGDFIWYQLSTPDPAAAAEFYARLLGWNVELHRSPDHDYRVLSAGAEGVGGISPLCSGDERPRWEGYIGVDDVDASVAQMTASGATPLVPPTDIPGVGRFAQVADPQGVAFFVMRGASDAPSHAFSPDGIGHCQWNELSTSDPEAAFAFYARSFGWQKGEAMPMGEMGDYQLLDHHGRTFGALMPQMPEQPAPTWTFYFGVADIDAAVATLTGLGATLCVGPQEVPGGVFIVVAIDPQGAMFALVGPRAGS